MIGPDRLRQLIALQYPVTAAKVLQRAAAAATRQTTPADRGPERALQSPSPGTGLVTRWEASARSALRSILSGLDGAKLDHGVLQQLTLAQEEPLELQRIPGCARALLDAGRLEDAEQLYRILSEVEPALPVGPLGRARIAMRRGHWLEAAAAWDDAITRAGDRAKAEWVAGKAQAFVGLGRWDEALTLWRAAIARDVNSTRPEWIAKQASALMKLGRWDEALTCWDAATSASPVAPRPDWAVARGWTLICLGRAEEALAYLESRQLDPSTPRLLQARLQCLVVVRRLPEARALFAETLRCAETVAVLNDLATYCARLFDDRARADALHALQARILKVGSGLGQGSAVSRLQLRVLAALRNYDEFLRVFDATEHSLEPGASRADLAAVAAVLRYPAALSPLRPKFFGIGLSRTGTSSLANALSALGLATAHWDNPLTGDLLGDDDLQFFDALLDTPACMNLEKNYDAFPNSKFIYTVRSFEDWERSWSRYTKTWWGLSDFDEIAREMQNYEQFPFGRRFTDIHRALYFNHENYREAFQAYDRRVRSFFADKPRNRFLEFNVFQGDGWEKLCSFLGREVPTSPFPHKNRGE
jgi:tetratricopeptide (TPR) repeat protein